MKFTDGSPCLAITENLNRRVETLPPAHQRIRGLPDKQSGVFAGLGNQAGIKKFC